MPRPRVTTVLALTAAAGFGIGAATLAYFMVRANITESVYRQRLEEVAARYENLRTQYNDAVRRTAVTELVVADGHLSVRIRNAAGIIEDIPTDYDPHSEIFVDYAIVDGRLWIRRVFDALTPPSRGLLIEPELVGIDWDDDNADFGKAVYRSLGEGRWVITASGDGSLALRPAEDDPVNLEAPPTLGTYEEMNEQLEGEIANISPADIWHALWND